MLYTGLFDSLGEEPAGPVVVVLTARLEVEVGQAPVLQLLAEVLHAHLHHTVSTAGATLVSPVGQDKPKIQSVHGQCNCLSHQ